MAHSSKAPGGVIVAIEEADKPYLARFTPALKGMPCKVFAGKLDTLAELTTKIKAAGVYHVITSRLDILKRLLPMGREKGAKIDNYAGSIIPYDGVEFLIVHPFKQLVTKTYGDFLNRRYVSKIVTPGKWRVESEFDWKIVDSEEKFLEALEWLQSSDLIGVDIETVKDNAAIRCSGYCGVRLDTNRSMAYVVPIKTMGAVRWMRELNAVARPKVFQNGKYDLAYYFRYNSPVWGYYFDTANMLHAWYAELPKDLASVSALLVRNSMYWKDLAETNDEIEYYKYNALDTWATVESAISWMLEAPQWALENYKTKFPQVPPSHMCEMLGMKRDMGALAKYSKESLEKQDAILTSLQKATGHPNFNPSSPVQVKNLLHVLGHKTATSSDEKTLVEAATKHPLTEWFVERILEYRGERKLSSTYLSTGDAGKEFPPPGIAVAQRSTSRILFALNPHGTDTGRAASREHHFWCGLQVQNVPGDSTVKETLIADDGFEFYEADYSQAEDRGVAYNSGDAALLKIFSSDVDSHKYKASMFFGIPYDEITKEIRQLGKRINHGANYNMGPQVLLETMGSANVRKAQKLLGLKPSLTPLEVCKHLLFLYERAFPKVKSVYYTSIKKQVRTTSKLVGATGWTRYCFGDPSASKMALNAYVAHVTQSLNAMILDKAFLRVFIELAFSPNFKLVAQIHDSILFQVRKGHDHLAERVKELMTFPVPVTDCEGITRDMIVPVDIKKLGRTWRGNE